ncbi:MAG: Uma2 family endonuclease [Myxococcales bacterium]
MLDPSLIAPEKVRPIKRVEYDRMVDLGLFASERVELLYGALVQMTPQGSRHAHVLTQLTYRLIEGTRRCAIVRTQMPLAVSEESEPEPDLALVEPADYADAHPRTALLVVEIADSSRQKDRVLKPGVYAAAGVPEYWVVDLVKNVVEVRSQPQKGRYKKLSRLTKGRLSPKAFPDVEVDVGALLGR